MAFQAALPDLTLVLGDDGVPELNIAGRPTLSYGNGLPPLRSDPVPPERQPVEDRGFLPVGYTPPRFY